jgi:hypothetical protein
MCEDDEIRRFLDIFQDTLDDNDQERLKEYILHKKDYKENICLIQMELKFSSTERMYYNYKPLTTPQRKLVVNMANARHHTNVYLLHTQKHLTLVYQISAILAINRYQTISATFRNVVDFMKSATLRNVVDFMKRKIYRKSNLKKYRKKCA